MNRKIWDKEAVIKDASKYLTVADWRKSSSSAYAICCRNKWNDEACTHMVIVKRPNGFWTKEKILSASKKYKTTAEWHSKDPHSYAAAKNQKLIPKSMERGLIHGKWTKENISRVAKDCKTRGEFRDTYTSAYAIAIGKGWLEDVCQHMLNKAPWFGPRVIREYLMTHDINYVIEYKFKEHSEVAKLPYDFYLPDFNLVIEYQGRQHKEGWLRDKQSAIGVQARDKIKRDFAKTNKINYLELDANTKIAVIHCLEAELTRLAKKNQVGFSLKGRKLTASELKTLETAFIWNHQTVKEAIAKCKTIKEFREKYPSAQDYARKHGIWAELGKSLMRVKEHGKYTKGFVTNAAKECKTRNEFKQKHKGAWAAAQRNGWLIEVCSHMPKHMQKPWLR
ncbi:hypothetical protein [Polynucleobacter sp. AM-7D1]|uniref:hypothetical protein n=1 Tax=Polynucleobacter sp. AM-7D1 TaxID=2689102 RepID=UPI001BFD2F9F|nr:hypothetical protein [Polynucleobacter sp. AM-7D1]QWE27913.1 hypothetical protein GQ359_05695 [Polynucleobacter sp. AM-7D1]